MGKLNIPGSDLIPDYTAGVSVASGKVVEEDCFCVVKHNYPYNGQHQTFMVNGVELVGTNCPHANGSLVTMTLSLKKGSTITGNWIACILYPY